MPSPLRLSALLLVAAAPLTLVPAALAQVDGVSYTASPVGAYTLYDGNAGLNDQGFYGGRVGVGFGRYVELDAEYLRGLRTRTALGRLDASAPVSALLGALPQQEVDVQRAGVGLRVNVGRTRLLPYLRGGAGVVQIDPVNVDATRSIYVTYGGGVTLSAAQRYTLTLGASRDVYRYSPFATFALGGNAGVNANDFPIRSVHNTAFTGSLRVYLGGRAEGTDSAVDEALRSQFTGRGPRVFVEPAYGQVTFSPDLGAAFPETQPFAGLSAGIDLGPYVGLRATYLRATDENKLFGSGIPSSFRDMALYGGELNLRFAGQAGRITPYLLVGGGYLNTSTKYDAPGTVGTPADRYFAQAGAGLDVPLASSLRLKGAVRSLLMSDLDAATVASPSRVYSSLMVSAGVEFSLGGRPRSVANAVDRTVESRVEAERVQMEAAQNAARDLRLAQREAVRQSLRAEVDSLRFAVAVAATDSVRALRLIDLAARERILADTTLFGLQAPALSADAQAAAGVAASRPNISGRILEIPVPERGEIYIRYGDPVAGETQTAAPIVIGAEGLLSGGGGLSADQVAALVRAELDRQRGSTLSRSDVDRLVRDAMRNMEATNSALVARIAMLEGRLAAAPLAPGVVAPAPVVNPSATASNAGLLWGRELYSTMPFIGVRTGGGVSQALVGIRGDFRLPNGSGMRFMPEVGVGVGDGISIQAFANTAWGFSGFRGLEPYAGLGAGIKTDKGFKGTRLAINLLAGVETPIGSGRGFAEFSTLDFFDVNRILVGYRFVF